ncbi:MAG TPA: sigma-70 family RNA polymerase sigma factor [Candidatus Borkfalkia faecigallinarum]|uniref:RNA polymerase sigma factor SigS n=1 Tax=Candidatus Borkfalkia faecigallinarum TaxID=2838509 RepID=A0A9D1VT64_9FIRM|nr:sigma-70 family RNA polymerase sigma factor [Candidatus Borkfalkia faecigallinarum]
MSDESLALAAQQGDKAAAEELLRRYKNVVRGVARSFFLAGGDAEDLAQEGMIGLYRAVTDFKEGGLSFKNFAYLCIQRRIIGAVRSAARLKNAPLNRAVPLPPENEAEGALYAAEDPEALLIGDEERSEFLEKLRGALSPAEYRALTLYMEGLSIAEIAARERRSEKSADNAVQRAKRKAAALLGGGTNGQGRSRR